jgi:hypothetical protein
MVLPVPNSDAPHFRAHGTCHSDCAAAERATSHAVRSGFPVTPRSTNQIAPWKSSVPRPRPRPRPRLAHACRTHGRLNSAGQSIDWVGFGPDHAHNSPTTCGCRGGCAFRRAQSGQLHSQVRLDGVTGELTALSAANSPMAVRDCGGWDPVDVRDSVRTTTTCRTAAALRPNAQLAIRSAPTPTPEPSASQTAPWQSSVPRARPRPSRSTPIRHGHELGLIRPTQIVLIELPAQSR